MKKLNKTIIATVLGAIIAGAAFTVQAHGSSNDATIVNNAKVSLEQAVSTALANVPGTAVKAKFENKKGQLLWEVEVLGANQQAIDVEIDANSGVVLKQQADKADREDDDENDNDNERDDDGDKNERD